MKKLIFIIPVIASILAACKEDDKPIVLDFDQEIESVTYTEEMSFAYVDRAEVGIYNLASQSVVWSWTAKDSPEAADYKDYFSSMDEVKPVNNCEDLIVCSTSGGVAMIHIADKSVKFLALPLGQPHSVELLPDGNIVVACSVSGTVEGNMLKVYKVDPDSPFVENYSSYIANYSGHNVVWDNYNDVLWATSDNVINIYSYSPKTLSLKLYKSIELPQSNAHELFPVYGEEKMWLTTSGNIYKFDIYSYECTKVAGRYTRNVKSVSSGPHGFPVLIIYPTKDYYTDTIMDIAGGIHYKVENAQFYKARWMVNNRFSYPQDK